VRADADVSHRVDVDCHVNLQEWEGLRLLRKLYGFPRFDWKTLVNFAV